MHRWLASHSCRWGDRFGGRQVVECGRRFIRIFYALVRLPIRAPRLNTEAELPIESKIPARIAPGPGNAWNCYFAASSSVADSSGAGAFGAASFFGRPGRLVT